MISKMNTFEHVLMWADGCSEFMDGHPIMAFDIADFKKANTLAYKFKYLESEGYILCTWEQRMDGKTESLVHCGITPKGIEYYKEIRSQTVWGTIKSKSGILIFGLFTAICSSLVTLWFK